MCRDAADTAAQLPHVSIDAAFAELDCSSLSLGPWPFHSLSCSESISESLVSYRSRKGSAPVWRTEPPSSPRPSFCLLTLRGLLTCSWCKHAPSGVRSHGT